MNAIRALILAVLAWSLLLLPGAAAAQGVQSSTDEKGTIRIGNTGPTQEKSGEVKPGEPKATAVKAPSGQAATEPPPPGLMPPSSRRPYGPAAEARRQRIMERHKAATSAPPAATETKGTKVKPRQAPPAAAPAE